MPSNESERWAVEWYVPHTLIGDGRPFNGTTFVDAPTMGAAWEDFVRRPIDPPADAGGRLAGAVVLRVVAAEDLGDVPPVRDVIDALGVS